MIILGIDPGSRKMGYGVIEKEGNRHKHITHGIIQMKTDPLSVRLNTIYTTLLDLFKEYTPSVLSIENIFYAKNVQSTIKLAHVRSIPILLAEQHNIKAFQFSPLEVKKSVVGYGRADKQQVQEMIKILLKLPKVPTSDAADALALALTYATTATFQLDQFRV